MTPLSFILVQKSMNWSRCNIIQNTSHFCMTLSYQEWNRVWMTELIFLKLCQIMHHSCSFKIRFHYNGKFPLNRVLLLILYLNILRGLFRDKKNTTFSIEREKKNVFLFFRNPKLWYSKNEKEETFYASLKIIGVLL